MIASIIVVCAIRVSSKHFFTDATVTGKVIAESSTKYLVDFSEDAKRNGFDGDYSKKLVEKSNCVKLEQTR